MRVLYTISRARLALAMPKPTHVAGVPLNFIHDIPLNPLYPHVTRDMIMGIRAWTHSMSQLSARFFEKDFTEYERNLYHLVSHFAENASQNPLFRINQPSLYRATQVEYCPPILTKLLHTPPPLQNMQTGFFTPYSVPEKPLLQFERTYSWTTHDLLSPSGALKLANAYPSTIESTDIVFVARNADKKNWGSMIGHLSYIPGEQEALTPPNRYAQVAHIGHLKRPSFINYSPHDKKVAQNTKHFSFNEMPTSFTESKAVHVVILDFVDAPV